MAISSFFEPIKRAAKKTEDSQQSKWCRGERKNRTEKLGDKRIKIWRRKKKKYYGFFSRHRYLVLLFTMKRENIYERHSITCKHAEEVNKMKNKKHIASYVWRLLFLYFLCFCLVLYEFQRQTTTLVMLMLLRITEEPPNNGTSRGQICVPMNWMFSCNWKFPLLSGSTLFEFVRWKHCNFSIVCNFNTLKWINTIQIHFVVMNDIVRLSVLKVLHYARLRQI